MALLTTEEQHEGRNAVSILAGIFREQKNHKLIADQDYCYALVQLGKIDCILKPIRINRWIKYLIKKKIKE